MFYAAVNLYRLLGRPSFAEDFQVDSVVLSSPELTLAIEALQGQDLIEVGATPVSEGRVRVRMEVPQHNRAYFYRSFDEFYERNRGLINSGKVRENFYVCDIDYASGEEFTDYSEIFSTYKLAEFVSDLRGFATINLDDGESRTSGTVVFLRASDGKSAQQATILKINVSRQSLTYNYRHSKILRHLKEGRDSNISHIEDKVAIMNSAIAEIISECEDSTGEFDYLLRNWNRVAKKYFHNLHAYMSEFSFDAMRKKITDSVMESTSKINGAMGEVGTKILAVPVSLVGLMALRGIEEAAGFWIALLGVILASLITFVTVSQYRHQLYNLIGLFEFNLKITSAARRTFSPAFKGELERIDNHIRGQKNRIKCIINLYQTLAALPAILAVVVAFDYCFGINHVYLLLRYCKGDFSFLEFWGYFAGTPIF